MSMRGNYLDSGKNSALFASSHHYRVSVVQVDFLAGSVALYGCVFFSPYEKEKGGAKQNSQHVG